MTHEEAVTHEELEKIKIVLGDALPYELTMLEAAVRYMEKDEFRDLDDSQMIPAFTRNATIEAFWTHARCLIEFFNRTKNNNYEASAASARDFTIDGYLPSEDMQKLGGSVSTRINEQISHVSVSTRINEQISHVGFCRKTDQWDKLSHTEMRYVKATINKETSKFTKKMKPAFKKFWKGTQPEALLLNVDNRAISTTNAIITCTIVIGS